MSNDSLYDNNAISYLNNIVDDVVDIEIVESNQSIGFLIKISPVKDLDQERLSYELCKKFFNDFAAFFNNKGIKVIR